MQPIGITFLPSEQNQAEGLRRGGLEGDLGQAFKILSLRLPRILGARAPASSELLNASGAVGAKGFNPMQAVFEALLRAPSGSRSIGSLSTAGLIPKIVYGG